MIKVRKVFLMALCLLVCVSALAELTPVKTASADEIIRIGIMRFQNRASGLDNREAEAITDVFTRMLSNSRAIAIIERDQLAAIGREHKLNMSGLVDMRTAVELGRIAGCQYMLLGAVTQFSKNVTRQKVLVVDETEYKVDVTIDMRVVDVATSEVVMSMAETGNASRKDSRLDLGKDLNRQEASMGGLEGEAISNAVSKLGQRIRETVAGEYSQVLSAGGKDITLNVGATSGARKGGLYRVYADGSEVLDMQGNVIGRKTVNIAVIRIVEVQNEFSIANVAKDGGNPANIRRGDKITPISSGEAQTLAKQKAFPKDRPRTRVSLDDADLSARLNEIADRQGAGEADRVSAASVASQVSTPSPAVTESAAAPAGKGIIVPSRPKENKSTDPAKVIPTYGLPSGDANTRRIAHLNARSLRNKQQAYDKYVELANSYSGDYLAAYCAGVKAQEMGDKDNARAWFEKALAINPNYEPAQNAKSTVYSAPAAKSKPANGKRRK